MTNKNKQNSAGLGAGPLRGPGPEIRPEGPEIRARRAGNGAIPSFTVFPILFRFFYLFLTFSRFQATSKSDPLRGSRLLTFSRA